MSKVEGRSGFEDTRGRPDIIAERAAQWLAAMDLNENQAVFSLLGLDPIIQPRRATSQGRGRLIDTGDLDSSALLANFAVNYIPERMKTKPRDLSETQWNMALWLLNEAAGGSVPGTTRLNNVLANYGLDLSTQSGLGELEAALGEKPSMFDDIELEIGEDQYLGILDYVRQIRTGSDESLRTTAARDWRLEGEDFVYSLVLHSANAQMMSNVLRALELPASSGEQYTALTSSIADIVTSLLVTWKRAAESLGALEALAGIATTLRDGASYLQSAAQPIEGAVSTSGIEDELHALTGPIVRRVLYGQGELADAQAAFTYLQARVDELARTAESEAERGADLFARAMADVRALTEVAPKGSVKSGPKRPDWA